MKFFKILLIFFGVLLALVGLLLWSFALSRKYQANWENWDGKIHLNVALSISAPIVAGIICILIASKLKKKKQN